MTARSKFLWGLLAGVDVAVAVALLCRDISLGGVAALFLTGAVAAAMAWKGAR